MTPISGWKARSHSQLSLCVATRISSRTRANVFVLRMVHGLPARYRAIGLMGRLKKGSLHICVTERCSLSFGALSFQGFRCSARLFGSYPLTICLLKDATLTNCMCVCVSPTSTNEEDCTDEPLREGCPGGVREFTEGGANVMSV